MEKLLKVATIYDIYKCVAVEGYFVAKGLRGVSPDPVAEKVRRQLIRVAEEEMEKEIENLFSGGEIKLGKHTIFRENGKWYVYKNNKNKKRKATPQTVWDVARVIYNYCINVYHRPVRRGTVKYSTRHRRYVSLPC